MNNYIMKNKICCFTGHRNLPADCDIEAQVTRQIYSLIHRGVDTFICGGARGFDLLCARILADMKEEGEDIKIIHAIPCPGQSNSYTQYEKDIYNYVLGMSDKTVLVSDHYFSGCMHKRNRFMVDNSAYIISYCIKNSGGSFYTREYARKQGLEVIEISDM